MGQKTICLCKTCLSVLAIDSKFQFPPEDSFFGWFCSGGWFALGGGVRQITPYPPSSVDKHIPERRFGSGPIQMVECSLTDSMPKAHPTHS